MIQKVVSPKGVLRYRDWTDKPTGKDGPLTEEENKALIDKLLNIIKGIFKCSLRELGVRHGCDLPKTI